MTVSSQNTTTDNISIALNYKQFCIQYPLYDDIVLLETYNVYRHLTEIKQWINIQLYQYDILSRYIIYGVDPYHQSYHQIQNKQYTYTCVVVYNIQDTLYKHTLNHITQAADTIKHMLDTVNNKCDLTSYILLCIIDSNSNMNYLRLHNKIYTPQPLSYYNKSYTSNGYNDIGSDEEIVNNDSDNDDDRLVVKFKQSNKKKKVKR